MEAWAISRRTSTISTRAYSDTAAAEISERCTWESHRGRGADITLKSAGRYEYDELVDQGNVDIYLPGTTQTVTVPTGAKLILGADVAVDAAGYYVSTTEIEDGSSNYSFGLPDGAWSSRIHGQSAHSFPRTTSYDISSVSLAKDSGSNTVTVTLPGGRAVVNGDITHTGGSEALTITGNGDGTYTASLTAADGTQLYLERDDGTMFWKLPTSEAGKFIKVYFKAVILDQNGYAIDPLLLGDTFLGAAASSSENSSLYMLSMDANGNLDPAETYKGTPGTYFVVAELTKDGNGVYQLGASYLYSASTANADETQIDENS